jgi:hypothetical protein
MSFLTNLMPSKLTLAIIGVLVIACGYLYLTKQVTDANMKTTQQELNEANVRVATQKQTITLMQKDAEVQSRLMDQYKLTVTDIRNQAVIDLNEIANTDFGAVANSNAPELEKVINQRTQALLDNFQRISRGN